MSAFEQLPPDQRATLSLLLRQGKSYAQVGEMLDIAPRAVHDRAHAALTMLEPALARDVDPDLRSEICDYVLGQQPKDATETRERIAASVPAREWAKALATDLVDLAPGGQLGIPEVRPPAGALAAVRTHAGPTAEAGTGPTTGPLPGPTTGAGTGPTTGRPPGPTTGAGTGPTTGRPPGPTTGAGTGPTTGPLSGPTTEESADPAHRHNSDSTGGSERPRVSRTGGFALLGVLAAVVIVVIVLVVSSGKGGESNAGNQSSQTSGGLGLGAATEESTGQHAGNESTGRSAAKGSGASEEETAEEAREGETGTGNGSSSGSQPKPHVEKTIVLTAPGNGKATGGVIFASEHGKHVFVLAAEHLEPKQGFEYVAWLVGSGGEAHSLGIAQVSGEGKLFAGNPLPSNYRSYETFELTRQASGEPTEPGQVVLRAKLSAS